MKLKFKPKITAVFFVIAILVVGAVHVGSNDVSGVLFSLTSPGNDVPGIDCWAKASTYYNGDEVAKSSFLANPPTFNLASVSTGDVISDVITHDGKIRCTFPIADESNTTLPLVIKAGSSFKVSVYAYEKGIDDKQLVFTQVKTVPNDVPLLWNTENTFVSFNVPMGDVISGLKLGAYDATVETRIEGTAQMYYADIVVADSTLWKFPIEQTDITTWFDFPLNKLSGKVGGVTAGGVFDKPDVKNVDDKSNDDITEFIECAKAMNTECLFNEKYNVYWMIIGVAVVGSMYMERSRQ